MDDAEVVRINTALGEHLELAKPLMGLLVERGPMTVPQLAEELDVCEEQVVACLRRCWDLGLVDRPPFAAASPQ